MARSSRLLAALPALMALGAGAAAEQTEFYRGKTLSIVVNYTSGGPTDTEARLLARHLPKHIPGAPTIIVRAMGGEFVDPETREPSDIPIMWGGEVVAAVRLPALHGALDRLIESVERELGAPLPTLSREDKQRAIRLLDERGAFILRRAVEDVADAMGVSRITVYNYLNALHR